MGIPDKNMLEAARSIGEEGVQSSDPDKNTLAVDLLTMIDEIKRVRNRAAIFGVASGILAKLSVHNSMVIIIEQELYKFLGSEASDGQEQSEAKESVPEAKGQSSP